MRPERSGQRGMAMAVQGEPTCALCGYKRLLSLDYSRWHMNAHM